MADGWIKLYRAIADTPDWQRRPFDRARAWVDLLLMAAWCDTERVVRGITVKIPRGCAAMSEVELAKKWGWSRDRVRRTLSAWEMRQQIAHQKNNVTSLIHIINYEKYQQDDTANNTPNKTANKTAESALPLDKEYKNIYISSSSEEDISRRINPKIPSCPHQKIISLWNETMPELPQTREFPEQFKKMLRSRWTENPIRQNLEWWREYFTFIRQSPFLMGQKNEFCATLEWVIRPSNMAKILNGNYHKNTNGKLNLNDAQANVLEWLKRKKEGRYDNGQG